MPHPRRVSSRRGRGQNPLRGSSGRESLPQGRKPSGVTRPHQPHKNVHRRSRPSNLSQPGVEPEKGSHCRTLGGKPQVPQDQRHSSHTKRGSARAHPTPSRRRGRRQISTGTERKKPHTQKQGPQPKHRRLAIVGEREVENRQTEQKRVHHKGSQGIEAKIPKKEQKSPN